MNSQDLAVANGQTNGNDFGLECSGVVTKVGAKVTNFSRGDSVAAISVSHSTYSSYTRTKAAFALKFNESLSYEDAATIPIAQCTAYYGLFDLARLSQEETVLIYEGASPVGQAAIALAQGAGAEVFATVATAEEKEILVKSHKLTSEHIFSNHHGSFGQGIRQRTANQGVDVVLNCSATNAETSRALWQSLASFGRFVAVDKTSKFDTSRVDNNASFMSADLVSIAAQRPTIMERLMSTVSGLLNTSKIGPAQLVTTVPISDVENAFKVLQSGNVGGKLVVLPGPNDPVKVGHVSLALLKLG